MREGEVFGAMTRGGGMHWLHFRGLLKKARARLACVVMVRGSKTPIGGPRLRAFQGTGQVRFRDIAVRRAQGQVESPTVLTCVQSVSLFHSYHSSMLFVARFSRAMFYAVQDCIDRDV